MDLLKQGNEEPWEIRRHLGVILCLHTLTIFCLGIFFGGRNFGHYSPKKEESRQLPVKRYTRVQRPVRKRAGKRSQMRVEKRVERQAQSSEEESYDSEIMAREIDIRRRIQESEKVRRILDKREMDAKKA